MCILYAQNKHTILIYSLEPPTTLYLVVFSLHKGIQGDSMKKCLFAFGITLLPLSAMADIRDCAVLECPEGYLMNLITCSYTPQGTITPTPDPGLGDCTKVCDPCGDWMDWTTEGVQTRVCYELNTASCLCRPTTNYRCAAGYYGGSSLNTTTVPTCTKCPDNGTSDPGEFLVPANTSITSCYLPAGTTGTNEKGTWKLDSNCTYSTDDGTI